MLSLQSYRNKSKSKVTQEKNQKGHPTQEERAAPSTSPAGRGRREAEACGLLLLLMHFFHVLFFFSFFFF